MIAVENSIERFTEKIFEYANIKQYTKLPKIQIENRICRPDYLIEKDNKKYLIEIKMSLDLDTTKINYYMNRFTELEKEGYKNILIVYNNVRLDRRRRFEKLATIFDISNILYIIRNNVILTNELMGILNYSIENIELKKPPIDIQIEYDKENKEEDRVKILQSIGTGNNYFKAYQDFCLENLKYLFLDILSLWEEQQRTDDGLNIFDLICKIKNGVTDDFFTTLENYFKSKYILFEFKNYSEKISQYEVCTTEKYLYGTALRKVAIIFTRKGISDNGKKMIKGILRETGKLILVLDDEDLKNMIEMKKNGENPTRILTDKLDFLLTHLEK